MISPIEVTIPVRIGSEYEHEFVSNIPDSEATVGNCYFNVEKKIVKDGGALVYGWAVWLGNFICEGEHHAVWEDECGNLVDITPHQIEVNTVFFIPDDRYVYKNRYIGNIRINIGNNPVVDHFILLSEMKDFLLTIATRIDDEKISFPNRVIHNMYSHHNNRVSNILLYLKEQGKLGTACYCGSTKVYSKCHGKGVFAAIEADKKAVAKFINVSPNYLP